MNIYDFDNTVYKGDCTLDFYLFAVKKHPFLLRFLPAQLFYAFLYLFQRIDKTAFKSHFYMFFRGISDMDALLESFWDTHSFKLAEWYNAMHTDQDAIISAAPQFLLRPVCQKLAVSLLIASEIDRHTGKCAGRNCDGIEKKERLLQALAGKPIHTVYTADRKDAPIAALAEKAFMVQNGHLIAWDNYIPQKQPFFKAVFCTRAFLAFASLGLINGSICILLSGLFSLFMSVNLSFVFGYILSLVAAYVLNTLLVFGQKLSFRRYVRFCISYIPNFIIQNLCVLLLYNTLGLHKITAFVLAGLLGVPVTFTILKAFTFKPTKKSG